MRDKEGLTLQCLYYGSKRENMVSGFIHLQYGDIITISNHGRFVFGTGWFIFIMINDSMREFALMRELEDAINTNRLQTGIDVMLDHSISIFYLDKSLVHRNKELFLSLSTKLKESSFLLHRITNNFPSGKQFS